MAKHIKIGEARTLSLPTNYSHVFDDRQQQIETIGGVVIEDEGYIAAGDKISFSANFLIDDFVNKIVSYWTNRTLVDVVDTGGNTWQSCRILVKSYSYVEKHETTAVSAEIEIWRV